MRPLKRSRKKPRPGDVFVMSYPVGYLFGRVVVIELSQPMPKSFLIYIYNVTFAEPTPVRLPVISSMLVTRHVGTR